jgi:TRAP-type C4-dicarboxylate transport system permease large subunit
MAIPFFILAGNFLTHGGVARRMINFATAMVGHWHGGLALGGIVACALFAAVSGSSPATVVAIGSIIMPAMVRQGNPKGFGVISFLLVVNVLLLLAGNVMEPSSIVLIMAPILFPVAMTLGIDPGISAS